MEENVDIQFASDYLITAVRQTGAALSVLKLQKLLYYAQGWHLALAGETLFQGKFQAWPQGPVNRDVYDRFMATKSLDSELFESDVSKDFSAAEVNHENRNHLDRVLLRYGKYEDSVLQEMIEREAPWREACEHGGERCEKEIDEDNMKRFCTVIYLAGLQPGVPSATPRLGARRAIPFDTLGILALRAGTEAKRAS